LAYAAQGDFNRAIAEASHLARVTPASSAALGHRDIPSVAEATGLVSALTRFVKKVGKLSGVGAGAASLLCHGAMVAT